MGSTPPSRAPRVIPTLWHREICPVTVGRISGPFRATASSTKKASRLPEEKARASSRFERELDEAARAARAGECELVVLDECCAAVSTGLLPIKMVTDFLDGCPRELEVVLTGRDPAPELVERADYITEMRKVKHPFDQGVPARKGIEW